MDAQLAQHPLSRLLAMTDGYRKAGDLMVEACAAEYHLAEELVFPILFNYRHFLELSLKYLLAEYGPYVGVETNWKTHDLRTLWASFKNILAEFGIDDPDKMDEVAEKVILEFSKVDPKSFTFRYPTDRNGEPIAAPNAVYIPNLAKVIHRVANYFEGCDGYLDSLKTASPY